MLSGCASSGLSQICFGTEQRAAGRLRIGEGSWAHRCSSTKLKDSRNTQNIEDVLSKQRKTGGGRSSPAGNAAQKYPSNREVTPQGASLTRRKVDERAKVLNDAQLLAFERNGHITIRNVLSEQQILTSKQAVDEAVQSRCLEALRHRMRVLLPAHQQIALQSSQQGVQHLKAHSKELGFLQHFNLHRYDRVIRKLVLHSSLASIAAQLLGTRKLRLYQDCVFLKEPGFSQTNWCAPLSCCSNLHLTCSLSSRLFLSMSVSRQQITLPNGPLSACALAWTVCDACDAQA